MLLVHRSASLRSTQVPSPQHGNDAERTLSGNIARCAPVKRSVERGAATAGSSHVRSKNGDPASIHQMDMCTAYRAGHFLGSRSTQVELRRVRPAPSQSPQHAIAQAAGSVFPPPNHAAWLIPTKGPVLADLAPTVEHLKTLADDAERDAGLGVRSRPARRSPSPRPLRPLTRWSRSAPATPQMAKGGGWRRVLGPSSNVGKGDGNFTT